ncbi:Phosphoserine aminotransferase [subsurface metagenome]
MRKAVNFGAGPAVLPESVLKTAQAEFFDYRGSGMSVVEISHRSRLFEEIIERTERSLRQLMRIPGDYAILFLQGGASSQFAMVPLNLYSDRKTADYVETGTWSQKAIAEAGRYGNVNVVASSEGEGFARIPDINRQRCDADADYFHVTMNNTIFGTRFTAIPDTGPVPLVADVSSCILSEEIELARFGLLYAGAQKNIGPAGLTVVILKKSLIGNCLASTPTMLNYATHEGKNSLFNTPPCFAIYMAGLVFEWVYNQGGVEAMEARNREKAGLLYAFIDDSNLFQGLANVRDRSLTNCTFSLPGENMTRAFLALAETEGLFGLKGHRSVGGLRASLYNAMPIAGVEKLVDAMHRFEKDNS